MKSKDYFPRSYYEHYSHKYRIHYFIQRFSLFVSHEQE